MSMGGCGDKFVLPPAKAFTSELRVTNHVGGAHRCVAVVDGRWIHAFACSIQVVDPKSLTVIQDLPLGEFGQCGPVVDFAVMGDRLFAVIEDDRVVEVRLEAGRPLEIRRSLDAEQMGILPRSVRVVGDACYVSGTGGVVNLATGELVHSVDTGVMCGPVAMAGNDLMVCVGRQVYRVADHRYLGAASDLVMIPAPNSADAAQIAPLLAFGLQGSQNALAGLMTPDIREIAGGQSTVAVAGELRRIRWFNDCLWLVGSQRIAGYALGPDGKTLTLKTVINMLGAADVDGIDTRTLAIVGTVGRAVYQCSASDGPEDGKFLLVEREAGRLDGAISEEQNVVAGSEEGAWNYLINARAQLLPRPFPGETAAARSAAVTSATAEITEDGSAIIVTPVSGALPPPEERAAAPDEAFVAPVRFEYREQKGARLHTVVAVNGKFWVGHDRGITILHPDGGREVVLPEKEGQPPTILPPDPVAQRLRLPGAITYLFPLPVGKGVSYVSRFGGFGVVRFVDEAAEAPAPVEK
jgi:hypothetical protein